MSTVIDHINLDLDNDGNAERYDLVSGASVHMEDGNTVVINNGNATSYDVHISNFEYSEEERVVGCWIDGRPVYEITLLLTSPSTTNATTYNLPVVIDDVINYRGIIKESSGSVYIKNSIRSGTTDFQLWVRNYNRDDSNANTIGVQVNSNAYMNRPMWIYLSYTKPTDKPNSFKPSMLNIKSIVPQHNYSTDEKIVGTWIDGKPIYERVVTSTNKPSRLNTVEEVYELDTNIIPISLNGMAYIDISHFVGYKSIVKMPLPSYIQSNYILTVDINSFNKIEMLITNDTWLDCLSNWILTIKYTKED